MKENTNNEQTKVFKFGETVESEVFDDCKKISKFEHLKMLKLGTLKYSLKNKVTNEPYDLNILCGINLKNLNPTLVHEETKKAADISWKILFEFLIKHGFLKDVLKDYDTSKIFLTNEVQDEK